MKTLAVICPVYNEINTIESKLSDLDRKEVKGCITKIYVVESNSTDGTRSIVQQFEGNPKFCLLFQDRPEGKGSAVRLAFEKIIEDIIIIQDADNEYSLEDYDKLLEPILNGESQFVLGIRNNGSSRGMRHFSDSKITANILNVGQFIFVKILNCLYNVNLKDPFTMYKIFARDVITGLKFSSNRFDFDHELVIKLIKKGVLPLEIPISYKSRSFSEGKKVRLLRDPLTWLWVLFKYRLMD